MNFKKLSFWIISIFSVVVIIGIVYFLTISKSKELSYGMDNEKILEEEEVKEEQEIEQENYSNLSEFPDLFGNLGFEYYTVDAAMQSYHFLYDKDKNPVLLAVGDIYSVDVDGDGISELINNATWADGGRATKIFKRAQDGSVLCGYADDLLDETYDSLGVGSQYSYYLPEENKVDIFFWKEDKQEYEEKKYSIDLSKIEMFPYDPSDDFSNDR